MNPSTSSGGPWSGHPLPPRIREALDRASRPVRPVWSPGMRAALVVSLALMTAAGLGVVLGLRPDAPRLGVVLRVGPVLVRVLAASTLLLLAMRECIPGSGPATAIGRGTLLAVPPILVLLAAWLYIASPGIPPADFREWLRGVAPCYPRELLVALPAAGLVYWLVARAFPLRSMFAMTAGATGAALVADAALHLTCPQTAWSHTLGVHGAAVATVALAAAVIGRLVDKTRRVV